ncbi:MAG: PD-(D/E)XK nuclease family protein [Desulfurellales bacterium]|nr:MAG: PD-(D/E)XK nuclease family protein [Desulfurellales bacterium]
MNWSFSSLMIYETCAYRFKLEKIDRLPKLPLPPDNPLERGSRIHERLEHFVRGTGAMDTEAKQISEFHNALDHMQMLYSDGKVELEGDWLFDTDWNVCDKKDVWLWSKLDFFVRDGNHGIVGDYKTGRSQYKAVEHVQQMQLYAAAAALRYPDIERLTVELWYLDEGHVRPLEFTQEQALTFVGRFDARAKKIFDEKLWRPNPSRDTCRYCPYSPRGTGACPAGV